MTIEVVLTEEERSAWRLGIRYRLGIWDSNRSRKNRRRCYLLRYEPGKARWAIARTVKTKQAAQVAGNLQVRIYLTEREVKQGWAPQPLNLGPTQTGRFSSKQPNLSNIPKS